MHTALLFRDEPYLQSCDATVIDITEEGHVVLNQSIFYPTGGGQPGDQGHLSLPDGTTIAIATTQWRDKSMEQIAHVLAENSSIPAIGDAVQLTLDWDTRFKRMRVHTALHLLSVILPYPVTGGSIGEGEGRLDFDIPEAILDKATLTEQLQATVDTGAAVSTQWISDEQLDAEPELVKTLSVQPPRGSGKIRLVKIDGLDLQPCGGTHVANISEIGQVRIKKIEKKGKQNRRVRIALAD
ncbi:MAG: alanyl-tRNA editing protein [Granulosicoccaceae bacterium]